MVWKREREDIATVERIKRPVFLSFCLRSKNRHYQNCHKCHLGPLQSFQHVRTNDHDYFLMLTKYHEYLTHCGIRIHKAKKVNRYNKTSQDIIKLPEKLHQQMDHNARECCRRSVSSYIISPAIPNISLIDNNGPVTSNEKLLLE